jgi:hypothetical protein
MGPTGRACFVSFSSRTPDTPQRPLWPYRSRRSGRPRPPWPRRTAARAPRPPPPAVAHPWPERARQTQTQEVWAPPATRSAGTSRAPSRQVRSHSGIPVALRDERWSWSPYDIRRSVLKRCLRSDPPEARRTVFSVASAIFRRMRGEVQRSENLVPARERYESGLRDRSFDSGGSPRAGLIFPVLSPGAGPWHRVHPDEDVAAYRRER